MKDHEEVILVFEAEPQRDFGDEECWDWGGRLVGGRTSKLAISTSYARVLLVTLAQLSTSLSLWAPYPR